MHLSRLIDYAEQNNIIVYDNVIRLKKQKAIAICHHRTEVILVAGPSRDERAKYLADILVDLIGHSAPDSRPKSDTACHGTAFGAALR